MTERLHSQFSLSYIGEGNGNPLQCSCLENPRDREPGGLPSMGSHRVGHDGSDLAAAAAARGFPGGPVKICLAMQGTLVQSLLREDPEFHGAAKTVHHKH